MLMKPTPMAMAVRPARWAPRLSPAPVARPTRTVEAMPTPSGTMKVIEAMLMAIWWAASEVAPNVPMTRVMLLNSMASKIMERPIGRPRRNTSASFTVTGLWKRRNIR